MSETEVQPLIPFIFCRPHIIIFLFRAHCVPCPVACLVPVNIVDFDENCHNHVPTNDDEKDFIPTPINRFIVVTVDLSEKGISVGPEPFELERNIHLTK